MTIFNGTPQDGRYRTKFVRVDERISISQPNDTEIFHAELVEKDDLVVDLAEAVLFRPEEADGGFMSFDTNRQRVIINGNSTGLDLPKYVEGRLKTIDMMQELLPEYEIRNLMPAGLRSKER